MVFDFLKPFRKTTAAAKVSKEDLEAGKVTAEKWKEMSESYKEETGGRSLLEDMDEYQKSMTQSKEEKEEQDKIVAQNQAAIEILNSIIPEDTEKPTNVADAATIAAQVVEQMAAKATPDNAPSVSGVTIGLNGPGTTATHFLGIPHEMYARSKRWNELAANPASISNPYDEEEVSADFRNAVRSFGKSMSARYAYLQKNNMLDAKKLSAFETDYSGLDNAKLGDQYIVRRQDALIARLIQMYDVYEIFPRRYGVQDRDVMFSAFFEQVSQAWQEGEVFKGGMSIQPEVAYVDDAMIKVNFPPFKKLERIYIGYLNEEGSDPMKLAMIEFQYMNIMETAINEQNHRRIMGIFVEPEKGVPGHYLHSSTGVVYTLFRYINENKLKPHSDPAFMSYTQSTMLDVVVEFLMSVKEVTVKDYTVPFKKQVIYLNENHQLWWKLCCRAKYAKDLDFSGPDSMLYKVPDIDTPIIWVPNMGQLPLMFTQVPRNIMCVENVPGEMLAAKMQSAMESLKFWSVWKEGVSASFVGLKFNDKAALDANNYKRQCIFMNTPSVLLADGATVLDGSKGFWFRTDENTAATALTDITNPEPGVGYILEIGDTNNPTTIAKSGKFSEITAPFNPTKVGDNILLVMNVAGDKFFELERTEGGIRKINVELQPNVPGGR
ncbi:hypothetical protein E2605_11775 [Dysgonomonas capnocytophagoides]|uniref:Uncharacterized protein n=1 Tax=Dysgonomonas capnocytophagoides TaxID=45254 RepID=A0A4Y8KYI4_9BACT|nr:hypothetical protein [Dysgonomonas capnocytophagoides]TFD95519.1 hypothetical protein E2605_11775 [Dysgonomonas capnocytophagoides]